MFKPLNLLSIDFNFFQKTSVEAIQSCYPKKHDLTTKLSEVVWSSYYVMPETANTVKSIDIDTAKLNQARLMLQQIRKNAAIMITNSHVKIYDFICNQMNDNDTYKINITNVDMCHDMFNENYELDCGNWIKFVSEDFDANTTWIANPISKQLFGLADPSFNIIKTDLGVIKPSEIDAVFICRNDTWTPPHLDKHFHSLLLTASNHFDTLMWEDSVKKPRDISELINEQRTILSTSKQKTKIN